MLQSKRGERSGNDTQSGDEQTGSPLHVLSDIAQKEGEMAAQPDAAALAADNASSPRQLSRNNGDATAGKKLAAFMP